MKKLYYFFIILVIFLYSKGSLGQSIYGIYEFTGTSTGDNQYNSVTTQPSFGTFSTFTRTNVTWESTANLFNSSYWNKTSSRDDGEYVSFALTMANPNTFNDISLDLTFNNSRSTTGPVTGEVMYRFGNSTFTSAGIWNVPETPGNFSFTISKPGNTSENYLEIRIHGWSANYLSGTMRFDNVKLEGASDPVPVELSSFSAYFQSNAVNLKWQTKTEVNNYGFEILRSAQNDNSNWTKIGFVNGHGNCNSPKDYTFTDKTVTSGKYIYRLKQIDTDGKYEFSKEVEVDLGTLKTFHLGQNYPNPFNPSTKINYSIPADGVVKLVLYTLEGELVQTLVNEKQNAGNYSVEFSAENLSSGMYIYKLMSNGFVQTKKMMLAK